MLAGIYSLMCGKKFSYGLTPLFKNKNGGKSTWKNVFLKNLCVRIVAWHHFQTSFFVHVVDVYIGNWGS